MYMYSLRAGSILIVIVQICLPSAAKVGNPACWDHEVTYDRCCTGFGGNPACWGVGSLGSARRSWSRCCLIDASGLTIDLPDVAAALVEAPAPDLDPSRVDCVGRYTWEKLAHLLNSAAALNSQKHSYTSMRQGSFGTLEEASMSEHIMGMSSLVFAKHDLGWFDCPCGLLSLVAWMYIQRSDSLWQAAFEHMFRLIPVSLIASSRWPVFRQLAVLNLRTARKFGLSTETPRASPLYSLRFMHIPKTGGMSVTAYSVRHGLMIWESHLENQYGLGKRCRAEFHCSADWWPYDHEDTFCTARNPYTRVVSAARHRGVTNASKLNSWVRANVRNAWKDRDLRNHNIVLPATAFMTTTGGQRMCANVLKTEHLTTSFCAFLLKRDPSFDEAACVSEMEFFSPAGRSRHSVTTADLSNSSILLINRVFEMDFKEFGYRMSQRRL